MVTRSLSNKSKTETESRYSMGLLLPGLWKRFSMYQSEQSTLNFTISKHLTALTTSLANHRYKCFYPRSFSCPQQTRVLTTQLLSYVDWVRVHNRPHENKYFIPTEPLRVLDKSELTAQKTTIGVDYWELPELTVLLSKTLTSAD